MIDAIQFKDGAVLLYIKLINYFTGKKQFVDIIPLSKVIEENVLQVSDQKSYFFPVLQHLTHMLKHILDLVGVVQETPRI